jgi:hypothetical protein
MNFRQFATLSTVFLIISLAFITPTFAQTSLVGVSNGETYDYNYSFIWTSTNPKATPPSEYVEFNKTQTIQMKITDVSGTRISLQCIKHFKDGTQSIESGYIDVDSGSIEVPYGYLIVSANLSANQKMYPSGGHQIITSTYMKDYTSGQRETNRYLSESDSETTDISFDKLKGVAVDYSYESRETSGGYTTTITEVLTNTNSDVWAVSQVAASPSPSVPEFSLLIVPVVLAAASAVLLLTKKTQRLPLKS